MAKATDQVIINAAQKVFYAKGYRGATMREIAKIANVNLALLHYYFGKKENLLEVVFNEGFSFIFFQFRKALNSETDIFTKIKLIIEGYIATGQKYPQLYGFITNEFAVNPKFMDALLKKYEEKHEVSIYIFDKQVKKAIQDKLIKPVDTRNLLLNILSLCLYPYVAQNFLTSLFLMDQKSFNAITKNRAEEVNNFIINSIGI